MNLDPNNPHIIALFDRRIEQIESGLGTLTEQMRDQSATLTRMSDALSAVVRLEERLTASIENSKEQRESLKRVHGRLDDQREALDGLLNEVYKRIDSERNECIERFTPVNNALQRTQGAVHFASVILPVVYTAAFGIGGWFLSSQSATMTSLQDQVHQVQIREQVQEDQIKRLNERQQ